MLSVEPQKLRVWSAIKPRGTQRVFSAMKPAGPPKQVHIYIYIPLYYVRFCKKGLVVRSETELSHLKINQRLLRTGCLIQRRVPVGPGVCHASLPWQLLY